MTKLEQLIQDLCPNGVKMVTLGDVVAYEQPSKYIVKSTEYDDSYDIPVLTAGQSFILGYTNEKSGIYPASSNCPVVIFDDFTTSMQWVDFPFKVKSSAMKILTSKDNDIALIRYLYFALKTIKYIPDTATHSRQWIGTYANLQIPLPPLAVQSEIVRILDKFTLYKSELAAELAARLQQYEYYRDKLLTFDDTVKRVKLGEVAEVGTGSSNGNEAIEGGAYPFFVRSKDIKRLDTYEYDEEAIIIPGEGGIGDIFHYVHGKFALHQRVYRIHFLKGDINTRFAYFYLCAKFKTYIMRKAVSATVTSIRKPMIENFELPLPPLSEQERIVSILDRFDTLCHDIREGLPAEIELRQKQYEHYRDKLLTFEAKG